MGGVCSLEGGLCVWGRKDEEGEARERLFDDISIISGVSLFAFLDEQELCTLAGALSPVYFKAGDTIVERGEPSEHFFVVRFGRAKMRSRPLPGAEAEEQAMMARCCGDAGAAEEQAIELHSGDHFCEEALLGNQLVRATVHALDELEVWALDQLDVDKLGLRHKLHFRKRLAITEGKGPARTVDPYLLEKTDEERSTLLGALQRNANLRPLLDRLCQQDMEAIVDSAYLHTVEEGDCLVEQGDTNADLLYMITEGTCDVIIFGRQVKQLGPGDSFGELGVLHRAPQVATVCASSHAVLWAVPRQQFRAATCERLRTRLATFAQLLGHAEVFKATPLEERQRVADALVEVAMYEGEYLLRQGDEHDEMLVLYEGEVVVEIDDQEVSRLSANPRAGHAEFFGERALKKRSRRAASVRVVSAVARVLLLKRSTYARLQGDSEVDPKRNQKTVAEDQGVEYSFERLQEVELLGAGAFGTVTLVWDTQLKQALALKALSKGMLVTTKQTEVVQREKLIMQELESPLLIRLAATFNLNQHICFLMEAGIGGDLYTVFRRQRFFGSHEHGRFYAACVFHGLEHLHERHIIHRDVKPENVFLDERGYGKLGDFGLATVALGHAYTLCGTPEYMAPEVIAGAGHSSPADWWALGVFVYESLVGESPFATDDVFGIFCKVQWGIESAEFPASKDQAGSWQGLVRQLCSSEPRERLAVRIGGPKNFMQHAWFASNKFDWQMHAAGQMEAPFVPQALDVEQLGQRGPSGALCGANYDALQQEGPACVPYVDPGTRWEAHFETGYGRRVPAGASS